MKIVYCCPQIFHPGGMERTIVLKANYLAEECGDDIYIITEKQKGNLPYYQVSDKIHLIDINIDYDKASSLPIFLYILKRIILKRKHQRILLELIKEIKPNIVISTFFSEASILPRIKDGSKKILEIHFSRGVKSMYANAFHFSLFKRLAYKVQSIIDENFIVPRYDKFVVLTNEDKKQWEGVSKNIIVIPNAISFENSVMSDLRNKRVIAVGRLDAQKGFDHLINLWAMVHERCPDWLLNIYGQGPDEFLLREIIINNNLKDIVRIHQPVKNILDKYRESSLFVMTSVYEGLPMVMLEAMSVGLPCVSFDFPCGPKDLINDGINGYLVNKNNDEAFVDRITSLMVNYDLRRHFGLNAFYDTQKYSIPNVMLKWKKLFDSF
jgi:glycosyltransferase involved in cell wall biosynthesis